MDTTNDNGTAAGTVQVSLREVRERHEARWRISGNLSGSGFTARRRDPGRRPFGETISGATAAELSARISEAEARMNQQA